METASIVIIIALVVLLLLSSFFSASEMAFSSLNAIRLKNMAENGSKRARRAMKVHQNYDKLLSSVLIGNNLVNIASTALATVLFVGFFGDMGVTISTVVMTILVLLIGEITPKTLAKEAPESFAMFSAPVLQAIILVLTPVNFLFTAWKKLILKLFRVQSRPGATEEELLTYVEEVRQDGGINEKEESMIRSAIEFDDLEAVDIFTPRVDVTAVALSDDIAAIGEVFYSSGYSRLPVYRQSVDDIAGVILEKDFSHYVKELGEPLEQILRPLLFVTKSIKIPHLLSEMQQKKMHMAVVLDEHGGTLGIVTIEDIVEELVGEIWDEHEQIQLEVQPLSEGRYRVLGKADLDVLNDLFHRQLSCSYKTVGGWVTEQLGKIPGTSDSFSTDGLRVEVEEMRGNRVISVVAEEVPAAEPSATDDADGKAKTDRN